MQTVRSQAAANPSSLNALREAVRGTKDLPLADALAAFAVVLSDKQKNDSLSLNIRTRKEGGDCKIAAVHEGGAAHHAGLSAGDTLLAIDGLRVSATNLDALLQRYRKGDVVNVHAFRRDELMEFELELMPESSPKVVFEMKDKPLAGAKLRNAWLRVRV